MVQAIQALRGVSLIVAAAIVAEVGVGCFGRFESTVDLPIAWAAQKQLLGFPAASR